jgi:hypothetical protein
MTRFCVMAVLVTATHVLAKKKDVDARTSPRMTPC